jgi:hypothetical protein
MAVAITATAGSASANSYVTLAEADTYMESRLNSSTWDDATTDNQNRALVEATRELDVLLFTGRKAEDAQALQWPRDNAIDPDSPNAFFFATTEIPQRVKDAQMELAFQFIKSGTTDVAALDATLNVRSKTIDVISTEYTEPYQRAKGLKRYPRVWNLIAPLLEGSSVMATVVRG